MKEFDEVQTEDQTGCPKRLWVMLTLSDDELVADEESLPKGLRFHLSRCSSCRALADRLIAVTSRLRDLAQLEPTEEVAIAANGQLRQALHEGATLTGRVDVADKPDMERKGTDRHTQRAHRSGPGWYGVSVAAAAVVVAVTLWGVWGVVPLEHPKGAGVGDNGQAPHRIARTPLQGMESPGVLFRAREGSTPDPSVVGTERAGARVGLTDEPASQVADARPEDQTEFNRRRPRICADDGYGDDAYSDAAGGENAFCVYRAITLPRRGQPPRQHATHP